MKKIGLNVLFIVYISVTLTITFFLNKYNDFGVIEFHNRLIVTSNKADMNYSKGTIVIITKGNKSLAKGDEVFYYTADSHKVLVSKGKISDVEKINDTERTITLTNSKKYSSEYIIGKVNSSIKIPILGYLLMILTSKIGYLVAILLPISIFFLIQIYSLFKRK